MYTNDLTYVSSPDSSFTLPVVCAYERWVFNSTSTFKLKYACMWFCVCGVFFLVFFYFKMKAVAVHSLLCFTQAQRLVPSDL